MRQPGTPKTKMGGKERLRLFLKGNRDLLDSLLSLRESGQKLDRGLRDLIGEKYHGAFQIDLIHEPCARSDFLIQQRELGCVAEELRQQGMDDNRAIADIFGSRLFEEEIDVAVFSLQPEISHSLWKHRQEGYLFCPPPHWEEERPPLRKQWLQEQFHPTGLLDVKQFQANFVRLIREIKERLGAHVIVYNCSSFDPEDRTSNYHNIEDTKSLRVQKFNLALMEISALEGISIIDVDRLIAELGGDKHVQKAFDYSSEACRAICREFLRVLEDIGFFEDRPLVPQLGKKRE